MVIRYEEVAKKWLKEEEKQLNRGLLNDKLYKNICKIFQWDLELNLIC